MNFLTKVKKADKSEILWQNAFSLQKWYFFDKMFFIDKINFSFKKFTFDQLDTHILSLKNGHFLD